MLHSTLPRAFLPPGLSYLGGYYGEDAHLYTASSSYVPIEDPYARISDQRVHLGGWDSRVRPPSPSPLDLSLKPPQTLNQSLLDNDTVDIVDDVDEDRNRNSQRRILLGKRSYSNCDEWGSRFEDIRDESDIHRSSSVHSYHSYDDVPHHNEPLGNRLSVHQSRSLQDDIIQQSSTSINRSYDDLTSKKETLDREISHKSNLPDDSSCVSCPTETESYHPLSSPKDLHLASPNHSRSHAYHQQLLLTPQHHLQGIHAPMTPPSTPSPPQCHRRRVREELDITPPQSSTRTSNATPKQTSVVISDKSRPKKKHARRLKFDEDTSSPVSGTVILGPDEAVVTGDIDPAFNIVEVTEEARAELAKIENRLGPYQCKLCRLLHDDAFKLAQHRCSRIAHVEYRCPECDKRFSCPANLASHRRWHKPRIPNGDQGSASLNNSTTTNNTTNTTGDLEIACTRCDVKFTRAAALRKHLATQHPESNNNVTMNNNNNNNNNDNDNDNHSGFDDPNHTMAGKTLCATGNIQLVNDSLTNEIP